MSQKKEEVGYSCPVSKKCGGCQLLHLSYADQLRFKQKRLEQTLKGLGRIHEITGMDQPLHYRNKVHAVFDYKNGNAVSGIYQEGTHKLVPVERCMIEDEKADEIISTIRGMLKSFKIKTYDEDSGYGFLRHVLIRRGFATGQIMVVLVTSSPIFPSKNNFVRVLREKHPEITTIVQNVNDRRTSMVLGEREIVLYGKGYIEDELGGCSFRISAGSFYQVNPAQTEKLYTRAIQMAELSGKETVIDAYCGIGTIGILAAKHAEEVLGAELNSEAVRDAVKNAKRNQIHNIQFYSCDAGQFIEDFAAGKGHAELVFMDPPRSGSTEAFISRTAGLRPDRVIYISCNPQTLARDLRLFQKYGYQAGEIWPYDMFPFTEHCECVACLEKNRHVK